MLDYKVTMQAAFLAAIFALIAILVMGFGIPVPADVSLQPTLPVLATAEFARATNQFPQQVLQFFTADSLFVLSYTVVFVGLFRIVSPRAPQVAAVALVSGLIAAVFDATENAFLIVYALQAVQGELLTDPALPGLYILANLKWMAAFAALLGFGLVWPRDGRLNLAIALLMVLFALVGVLGVAWPSLIALRGLFFLLGMPLFAATFWQQARR